MKLDLRKWLVDRESYEKMKTLEEHTAKHTDHIEEKCFEHIIKVAPVFTGRSLLGQDLCSDLELVKNYNGTTTNTVADRLCFVSLKGSRYYFDQLLSCPIFDHSVLQKRQTILADIDTKSTNDQHFDTKMQLLAKYEPDVLWLFDATQEELASLYDMVYFKTWFLKMLNHQPYALTGYNLYRIIISPMVGLITPITYFVIPYLIFRVKLKVKIGFTDYIKMMWMSIFSKDSVLNIFGSGLSKIKYVSYALSILFYFQGLFNSVEISKAVYKISKLITSKIQNVSTFLETAQGMISDLWPDDLEDGFSFGCDAYKPIHVPSCNKPHQSSVPSHHMFTNFGKQLQMFKTLDRNDVAHLVKRVYVLDVLSSIRKLKTNLHFTNVAFDLTSTQPVLNCQDIWHPCLEYDGVVKNTLSLGSSSPNNIILTGPNAGGKSTIIKSVLLSVVLSQTLCVANADALTITPFYYIHSQINIPDSKGKESLFEAEMYRSKNNLDTLAILDGKPSIIVMDEIFNSTNPVEGIAGAFAIAKRMSTYKSNISIISTHYLYLTRLSKQVDASFTNYKMNVIIDNESITYPYKLTLGVSKQYIALELLRKNGFDDDIIKDGLEIKNKLVEVKPKMKTDVV